MARLHQLCPYVSSLTKITLSRKRQGMVRVMEQECKRRARSVEALI